MAIDKLNTQFVDGELWSADDINPITNKIDETIDVVNSHDNEIVTARGGETDLNTRITNIQDEIVTARGGETDLNTRITDIQNEIVTARDGETDLNTRITNIADQTNDNTNEISIARGSYSDLNGRISYVQNLSESTNNEVVVARGTYTSLNQRITYAIDFGRRYFGSLSSDPTTAPDGSPLQEGDEYYNTTEHSFKYYDENGNWVSRIEDADTLNGYTASPTPVANSIPVSDTDGYLNNWIKQGSGSGLDADTLDGKDYTYFAVATDLSDHINNTSNPHNVTKTQVGLGNVQNVDTTIATNITVDTSNFSKNLSSTDSNVQQALETLDKLFTGSSVGGVYGINVESLTADKTLTPGADPIYQYLDPNGAYRTITLDTANASAGDRFIIRNNGAYDTTYSLNIYQGTTWISSITAQAETEWIFDGTNWVSIDDPNQNNLSIGYRAFAYSYGVALGSQTDARPYGVAVGWHSSGSTYGTGVGYYAIGGYHGVAVGYQAYGNSYGISIGYNSNGSYSGIAIGYESYGKYNGTSIGYKAGYSISSSLNPNQNLFIGYQAGMNVTTASTWIASTSYSVGNYVNPTSWNGYSYKCTVAGTSGSTEPAWPTTIGDTVTDGGVTWECVAVRGNNNIYIGYDIEGQQNDTNQLNIGNLIYGNLYDKYWMIPQNVNIPTAKSGFGILYVASDGSLHYLGQNGTDTQLASA